MLTSPPTPHSPVDDQRPASPPLPEQSSGQAPESVSGQSPMPATPGAPTDSRRIIGRFLPKQTHERLASAVRAGHLHEAKRSDVLAPERLPMLAEYSLWLLIIGGFAFLALEDAARYATHAGLLLGNGSLLLRLGIVLVANGLAYAVMVPLHEAVHAAVILVLGGRPRFGLKLPFAAYCTAPNQLFTRNGYLAVALAPLIALSLLGAVVIWLAPDLGACLLFGFVGNVAGAVGDLVVSGEIARLPANTLIADDETGYTAYRVTHSAA
ncbi:MAG: DUF3267 domain-containing protein [Ktedonobacterales bacterium]